MTPPFADNSAVIVKRARIQLEKSAVTATRTLVSGARLPSGFGNEPWITGVHAAPFDCESVTRVSCVLLSEHPEEQECVPVSFDQVDQLRNTQVAHLIKSRNGLR